MRWSDSYILREERLAWRIIGDQAVVINPRDNMLYPMNPVAARFWELADGSRSLSGIVAILFDEFEVERQVLEHDVQEFAAQLAEKGLIGVYAEAGSGGEKAKT